MISSLALSGIIVLISMASIAVVAAGAATRSNVVVSIGSTLSGVGMGMGFVNLAFVFNVVSP